MNELPVSFSFTLPEWTPLFIARWDFSKAHEIEERMRFAIALAAENVKQGTGGPFGAAIFNSADFSLISAGVNCVVPSQCSMLHAEIAAIMLAEARVQSFTLGPNTELLTSVAPCAMCLGAIPWSGIKRLVCGAREEDARAIGFDEGAKPANWKEALSLRGIETITDICRDEARKVLTLYGDQQGIIYNS